ncbi:MAG: TRAP transporter small permease subunit [Saprospiraceae bacterium]|nr:TRAP transporter small permease subunit [Saprospiraceae bacterium]
MLKILDRISGRIDAINEWVGRTVSWLNTALVLLVCFDVITRYFFSETQAWIMELEWHFFALIFLLGAGYALKHDRHVRVDLFYANFSPRDKALVNFVGGLLFLIPWCGLLIYFSLSYANVSFAIGETSPDPGGLPARYVIKYAIALGMLLLFLQALAEVINAYLVLRGYKSGNEFEGSGQQEKL